MPQVAAEYSHRRGQNDLSSQGKGPPPLGSPASLPGETTETVDRGVRSKFAHEPEQFPGDGKSQHPGNQLGRGATAVQVGVHVQGYDGGDEGHEEATGQV